MGLGVCFTITLCRLTITPRSDDSNPSCVRGRVLRLIACWAATSHNQSCNFSTESKYKRTNIGLPAKRFPNDVSMAGQSGPRSDADWVLACSNRSCD